MSKALPAKPLFPVAVLATVGCLLLQLVSTNTPSRVSKPRTSAQIHGTKDSTERSADMGLTEVAAEITTSDPPDGKALNAAVTSQNYSDSVVGSLVNSGIPQADYSSAALHKAFIASLPPAPADIAFGSKEHLALYRSGRISNYIATSYTGKGSKRPILSSQPSSVSAADNPYNKIKEGGVLALVGQNVGVGAASEAELLSEYRREKVTQYQSSVIQ